MNSRYVASLVITSALSAAMYADEPARLPQSVVDQRAPTPAAVTRAEPALSSAAPVATAAVPAPITTEIIEEPRGIWKGRGRRRHYLLAGPKEASILVEQPNGKIVRRAPPPFDLGEYRYEPRVRDIRYLPNSINLPTGKDYGAREMLPVIENYDKQNGYFLMPRKPPRGP